LIGEDKNTTIIYGDKFRNVINVNKNNISISNLSIGMNGFLSNNSNLSFSGIYFKSNSNIIENCIISNNIYGIIFENSSNNIISNCIFSRNNNGLHFINSSYNQLSGCNIIENEIGVGILLEKTYNSSIVNSNISSNDGIGILLRESNNNKIFRNLISENEYGIRIFKSEDDYCSNNFIYENNFVNNFVDAYDDCNNKWDNDLRGNFWDGYTGNDDDNDGIGDIDFYIPLISVDRFPLMKSLDLDIPSSEILVDQILINITSQRNNSKVSGLILLEGEVFSKSYNISMVKIMIDDGELISANGTNKWSIEINTTIYENGMHEIHVFTFLEDNNYLNKKISLYFENKINDDVENDTPYIGLFPFLISIIFIVILVNLKNSKFK